MPGSHITDHQVRFYMLFRQKNALQAAAAKAGFSTGHDPIQWTVSLS